MKFSTRTRYGLRLMVELTRALQQQGIVQLGQIAHVTGISLNYLAQLTMPLKSAGLIIGVSGKKGGYVLARGAAEISVSDVVTAVQGPVGLTDCVNNPDVCLNSSFCEARMVWVVASHHMTEILRSVSLADMVSRQWKEEMKKKYEYIPLLDSDSYLSTNASARACPANPGGRQEESYR